MLDQKIEKLIEEAAGDFIKKNAIPLGLGTAVLGLGAYGLSELDSAENHAQYAKEIQTDQNQYIKKEAIPTVEKSQAGYTLDDRKYQVDGPLRYTPNQINNILDELKNKQSKLTYDLVNDHLANLKKELDGYHNDLQDVIDKISALQDKPDATLTPSEKIELDELINQKQQLRSIINDGIEKYHKLTMPGEESKLGERLNAKIKEDINQYSKYKDIVEEKRQADLDRRGAYGDAKALERVTKTGDKINEKLKLYDKLQANNEAAAEKHKQTAELAGIGSGLLGAGALGTAAYSKFKDRNKK